MAWDFTKMFAASQDAHSPHMHGPEEMEENPEKRKPLFYAERRKARLKRERAARMTMYQHRKH